MERRKQYNEKQVEQDLYQYEMGIELGADVEAEKRNHQNEYDKEHSSQDFKNNFNNNNQSNSQRNNHPAIGKKPKSNPVSNIPIATPIKERGSTQRMIIG